MASDGTALTVEEIKRARATLADLIEAVEAGDLEASDVQLAHLRGSLAALEALGEEQ
jgi:hypothetical protein